ncbi:hypothetical protein [Actinoplanes sp. N902-109]|uniref:hypothetical protein n=1 Tax=Actinoplanes sp. (strain N902-109) TaxID=649831 RepID=UPI0003293DD1|nr:hypothetical protein [Actinoplanes sp. N902-109]AGL20954.1 hypothetical protein L083_7444 [Actinoplanes sp. N902-109]
MTDPIPDREQLRQRSADGLQRAVPVAVAVGGVIFAVILAFAVGLRGDLHSGSSLVVVLAGLAAAVAIVMTTVYFARRRADSAPLLFGADRPTRGAVREALRTGGTSDPRIDALARDAARIGRSQRWVVVTAAFVALIEAASLVTRIIEGEWFRAATAGALLVLMGVVAATKTVELRRHRAYLRQPGPASGSGTAA